MLLITCPWCGERHEQEFTYGGDASPRIPNPAERENPASWLAFVYERDNPAGHLDELWHHSFGCGKWIRLKRDTLTNEFIPEQDDRGE